LQEWINNQKKLREWFEICKIDLDKPLNIYNHFRLDKIKGSVLDIGAGHPKGTWFIDKFENYTGIDSMPYDKRIKRALAECLPFKDKSFDYVLCMSVLQHCINPIKAVSEMKRVCKDMVFVTVYCSPKNDLILHEFTPEQVINLFGGWNIRRFDVQGNVVYMAVCP
jgi:SAM-dependent methyltransferase